MPVFRSEPGTAPSWCEMEYFDIVRMAPGECYRFERLGEREKLIVVEGACHVGTGDAGVPAVAGANLDLTQPGQCFDVTQVSTPVVLVRMCGRWGEETGGSGLFAGAPEHEPHNPGDPTDYPRNTVFDNHYHDCDEYWIIVEGRCVAWSEGRRYEVGPGDCVATGMGFHHDLAEVGEPVRAVYFETTMEGRKRPGHLWNHTHGEAEPRAERV